MISAIGSQRSIARCIHTKCVYIAPNAPRSSPHPCTAVQQANGLFKNYADNTSDINFDDAASSALLASTVYRLGLLTGNKTFIKEAELTRIALFATDGMPATPPSNLPLIVTPSPTSTTIPSSSSYGSPPTPSSAFTDTPHFTSDGWLAPVVNPRDFSVQGAQSPEGQAFVLMLQSAWRDWFAATARVKNAAPPPTVTPSRSGLSAALFGMAGLVMACNGGLYEGDAR